MGFAHSAGYHGKVKSENFKFRADLKEWVVTGTVNDTFQRQIAVKIFKSKVEACPVNAGLHLAVWHCFSFATVCLQTFVFMDGYICLRLFPSLSLPASEVAVSWCPFLGQVVNLDLLFCTGLGLEQVDLFQYLFLSQRSINDRKINPSDFGLQDIHEITSLHFHIKKTIVFKAQHLPSINLKTFWLLNWVIIARMTALLDCRLTLKWACHSQQRLP